MKKLLLLMAGLLLTCSSAKPASATVCTNNAYNNITCVKTANVFTGACGTVYTSVISVANIGDRLILWQDSVNQVTAVSDNSKTSGWSAVSDGTHSLNSTQYTGIGAWDGVWTAITTATGNINITLTCSGGVSSEIGLIELHSSVGTVGIDCVSGWVTSGSGTTSSVTSNCTPTHANSLGMSSIDFDNSQPTVGSPWAAVNDAGTGGEQVFGLHSFTTVATQTSTWSTTPASHMMTSTFVVNDGSSGGPPPNQFPRAY